MNLNFKFARTGAARGGLRANGAVGGGIPPFSKVVE